VGTHSEVWLSSSSTIKVNGSRLARMGGSTRPVVEESALSIVVIIGICFDLVEEELAIIINISYVNPFRASLCQNVNLIRLEIFAVNSPASI
jgi:hypothetical protein